MNHDIPGPQAKAISSTLITKVPQLMIESWPNIIKLKSTFNVPLLNSIDDDDDDDDDDAAAAADDADFSQGSPMYFRLFIAHHIA